MLCLSLFINLNIEKTYNKRGNILIFIIQNIKLHIGFNGKIKKNKKQVRQIKILLNGI